MAALPIAKLFYLAVRTAAKPVAGAIRRYARSHARFRAGCVRVARLFHAAELRLAHRSQRGRQPAGGGPSAAPDEARAVELGAEFIGEAVVFGVAGAVLVADVLSARRAEAVRRAEIESRISALERRLQSGG